MVRSGMLLSLALLCAPALAGELHSFEVPDEVVVEGAKLRLNGMGTRTKLMFKVYLGALYLEKPSHDGAAILASDQAMRMRLVVMMSLSKQEIATAFQSAMERTAGPKWSELKERFEKLAGQLRDTKKGESVTITYLPNQGIVVETDRAFEPIAGRDFARALFAMWVGPQPVDEDLKRGVLGSPQ